MKNNLIRIEQRKYKRYKPREDTFIAFNAGLLQLGRIINIGKGGLAFCCADNKKPIVDSLKMDIFLANDWFHLPEIPYKIVSEFSLDGNISDHGIKLRQCCVAYGPLTHFQTDSLECFLKSYTLDNL